ncbi:hypothetical protein [Rhizobium sp. IY2]|uniref:hypothetical protein n=1 Tax=Rhizobium sp. IY2 TaxID=3397853 RepID=UPI0039E1B7B3
MGYGVSSRSYLKRAKCRINENTDEGLFYAALELRSFLEARQDEYLDAQRTYAKSMPAAWETSKQWKALQRISKSDKIQHLNFSFSDGWTLEAFHVPVTETFRKATEKLSDMLHAQAVYRPPESPWWEEARHKVIAVYRSAWLCQQGTLLCPALVDKDMIEGRLALLLPGGETEEYAKRFAKDQTMFVKVNYLESVPNQWSPDL